MNPVTRFPIATIILLLMSTFILPQAVAQNTPAKFGPSNPFYAPSTLPYQAPPFDKIKDDDYQPAIEAGMEQQKAEI
jgi:peptidyl-dipeptidase Dcp